MYGQEAVFPVEVNLDAYGLAKQNDLSAVDYYDLMMDNIDEVTDKRLKALNEFENDKFRVARAYNKKVKLKSFQVGDLGPYKIIKAIFGNSYVMEMVQGERLPRAINGRYLKKYYPSVWQSA